MFNIMSLSALIVSSSDPRSVSNLAPLAAICEYFDDLRMSNFRGSLVERLSHYTTRSSVSTYSFPIWDFSCDLQSQRSWFALVTGGRHRIGRERAIFANHELWLEVHDCSYNCMDSAGDVSSNVRAVSPSNSKIQTASERTTNSSLLDTLCRASNGILLGRPSINGKPSVITLHENSLSVWAVS